MNASRDRAFAAEFAFNEIVIVERFLRQIQIAAMGFFRPTRLFIRATFGAGPGVSRHFGAAVWTNFRGHPSSGGQSKRHSMPAYSSSVFRLSPIRTYSCLMACMSLT